ncbi:phage head spike fiber domain-containing protein [Pseudomonas nitroreducens]|uniref:phage head spike fiber domain-containing protein n=1 Tax=Pseudomonas nitroreducens TaxID=46680 RepID=UPI00265991EC|nr:hypothetical protein [Pseudomonas nitroreducens]MCP1651696.1 hypothetical protein [Pseudomonas nitroreducens]MCP1684439.1 hypothetical protein [Pseudomonas nitroreducens]
MIPIVGFAPDADVTAPGILSTCSNLVPYLNGMEGGPSPSTPSSTPPLPSACLGAAVVAKLDDTRRILAGTADMILELAGGAWIAQGQWSRASTATYYDSAGVLQTAGINVPRNTYNPFTLQALGFLRESAATNLMTQSSNFSDASWTKTNVTITAAAAVAVDGTTTASKIVGASGTSSRVLQSPAATLTNVQVTGSLFVKAVEYSKFQLQLSNSSTESLGVRIDLVAGTVYAVDASGTDFTAISGTVTRLSNNWYRCTVTANKAAVNNTVRMLMRPFDNSGASAGDGTSGLYIWGAQLETGPTATSYIPTTTVAVTRAADVPVYTSGTDTRWMFAQFGDATLATNRSNNLQRSTGGSFTDVATAPKAEVIFTVGAFVMALNLNDGSEKPDGWACSAAYDDTSWTPSLATQATAGRLVATAGRLTAGMRLGEYAVAYKQRSIYLGQYVGAPTVWNWLQVPGGEAGCVGKEAICDIGGAHFFVGDDNMWIFDGTRPIPVADGTVRQWFYDNCNPQYRYRTICTFDRQKNLVWVFFPSNSSSTPDSAIVYHVVGKRWGIANRAIEAALNYVQPGVTIDGLPAFSSTIDGLSSYSFDSQFWLSGGKSLAVFDTSHQLQSMTGVSTSSSMTTGEVGDDYAVSSLSQIRLRYALAPSAATAQVFIQQNSGVGFSAFASGTVLDGKFDVRTTARWHKAAFSFTGPVKITHMDAELTKAGMR